MLPLTCAPMVQKQGYIRAERTATAIQASHYISTQALAMRYIRLPARRHNCDAMSAQTKYVAILTQCLEHTLTLPNRPVMNSSSSSHRATSRDSSDTIEIRSGASDATDCHQANHSSCSGQIQPGSKPSAGRSVSRRHQTRLLTSPLTLPITEAERRYRPRQRSE
jgi:hypothetical protein